MTGSSKTIVLLAAPHVRTVCPPEFIEGQWRVIPAEAEEIAFNIPTAGRIDPSVDKLELEQVTLVARPSGKIQQRDDGAIAPVWEIRRPSDWETLS